MSEHTNPGTRNPGRSSNGRLAGPGNSLIDRIPWWLAAALLLALIAIWTILNDKDYRVIFRSVGRGMVTTVWVSMIAFLLATALGLVLGLMRVNQRRLVRETASFYVEIVRGIPMLVILYYIAFVAAPGLVVVINFLSAPLQWTGIVHPVTVRQLDFTWRAILALMIGYSAFISEIIRAGIESIPRGQTEAALALGMSRWKALRHVVLPQAIRNVLPPMGNEFVAMVKDSALVSALGVQDITQLGKIYATSTFRFFETYNMVAFLYLILTISLSLMVRRLEQHLAAHKRHD